MKHGRDLEVPACVMMILAGVWIVDSGRAQSQKDCYGIVQLAIATFKKYNSEQQYVVIFHNTVVYHSGQFCWIDLGLLMHLHSSDSSIGVEGSKMFSLTCLKMGRCC